MYKVKCKIYSHKKGTYIKKTVYLESAHDAEMLKSEENNFGMVESVKKISATNWVAASETIQSIWEAEGGED